ncbi:hypothetical protein [Nocardia amamiensis]|uniref:hypothetical protein n=1 Tax=Nocardia TaxID=1817 RepID=UPI0033DEEC54
MTDGDNDYVVSNASEYVNAVYKLGHRPKVDAESEPAAAPEAGRRRRAKSN